MGQEGSVDEILMGLWKMDLARSLVWTVRVRTRFRWRRKVGMFPAGVTDSKNTDGYDKIGGDFWEKSSEERKDGNNHHTSSRQSLFPP